MSSAAALLSVSGQPGCPGCGSKRLLATLSERLRGEWKRYECISWSWHSERQAYWHFCVDCHNEIFTDTPRAQRANRYNSAPELPGWQRREPETPSSVRRFTGEFYLTAPCPERWTAAAREQTRLGLEPRTQLERRGFLQKPVAPNSSSTRA